MAAPDAPPAARRRVVVVPGMHRAGTSVVARGLLALGFDLGDALMSADVRMNARGFFEDVDVVALDDALLAAQGADWKSIALLADADWGAAAQAGPRAAARRLLERKLARSGAFAFKDPRVPRLLPFWQRVFADAGVDDAYVIAVRHPRAVIASLTARDGFDPRRSGWLWLTHLVCALRYTQGRRRVVVDYDRLLAAPVRELARVVRALQLPPAALDRADVDVYAREFLTGELRHAEYAADDLPEDSVPPGVPAAHALAQRLARDEADPASPETVGAIDEQFGRLAAVAPLLAYAGSVERIADATTRIAGELAWARSSLAEASAFSEDLRATLAAREAASAAYVADLVATIARKDGELATAHELIGRVGRTLVGRHLLRKAQR